VSRALVLLLPGSLVAYSAFALASGRWLSGIAALAVAWLLWRRHGRARFSAYVLLTVLLVRALVDGAWPLAAYAAVALSALQAPAARRAWPRLRPGLAPRR
jgi:hypothetical protein